MSIPYLHADETKLLLQVKADLERHEAFREYAYPDPLSKLARSQPNKQWGYKPARQLIAMGTDLATGAPWTFGFGFTRGVNPDSRIDRTRAERILEEHILEMDNALASVLSWYRASPFVVKTVLINMAFNMGIRGLLGFRNTLAHIKAGRYKEAAHNMTLSRWYAQTGSRAKELVRRMLTQTIEPQFKALEKIQ